MVQSALALSFATAASAATASVVGGGGTASSGEDLGPSSETSLRRGMDFGPGTTFRAGPEGTILALTCGNVVLAPLASFRWTVRGVEDFVGDAKFYLQCKLGVSSGQISVINLKTRYHLRVAGVGQWEGLRLTSEQGSVVVALTEEGAEWTVAAGEELTVDAAGEAEVYEFRPTTIAGNCAAFPIQLGGSVGVSLYNVDGEAYGFFRELASVRWCSPHHEVTLNAGGEQGDNWHFATTADFGWRFASFAMGGGVQSISCPDCGNGDWIARPGVNLFLGARIRAGWAEWDVNVRAGTSFGGYDSVALELGMYSGV